MVKSNQNLTDFVVSVHLDIKSFNAFYFGRIPTKYTVCLIARMSLLGIKLLYFPAVVWVEADLLIRNHYISDAPII